jgi:acetyl esterase/lipase
MCSSVLTTLLLGLTALLLPTPARADAGPAAVLHGGHYKVKEVLDIPYYEGPDAHATKHKLDLYLPENHQDFPVLFFVHGGAWRNGDKQTMLNIYGELGRTLARNGIGAVITNYRLSPAVKHPTHIQDVAKAFAWTVRNISKYGGRADQLFVCGHSAGGHLVALLATDENYLKAEGLTPANIKGVIPISGVYVIDTTSKFYDAMFGTDGEVRKQASPVEHVRDKPPPFLVMYASDDYRFLDQMAIAFVKALQEKKIESKLLKIDGRTHITIVGRLWRQEDEAFQALLGFIAQHAGLKLTPMPDTKP